MLLLAHAPDVLLAGAFFAPVLLLVAFYVIGARLLPPDREKRDPL